MTFLEAALEILRHEGKPLHYKELTEHALGKKLLTFVGRTPEVTMQTQLTAAVKKAPGNPFVRTKPGFFGLLRYPEVSPAEREAYAKADAPASANGTSEAKSERGGERDGGSGDDRARRRRRRGRGRGPGEGEPVAAAGSAGLGAAAGIETDTDSDEPLHAAGLSPEARAAALAETGVLEGDVDEATADEEDHESMEDDEIAAAGPAGDEAADDDEADDEGAAGEGTAEDGAPGTGGAESTAAGGELAGGRRRRRRRRRGRGGEPSGGSGFGDRPQQPQAAGAPLSGDVQEMSDAGASAADSTLAASQGGEDAGVGGPSAGQPVESQGPRRIMTPVDAALEILRGQAPGRGVHVRQIADGATRRRLVHGEPNEAWRVMRTALAAEPRERLRAGLRPRVRAAGAGLYALARRPPDAELERAEQVFGEARRALRERTAAALERRIAELPASAFEALARVLLQREGFGPATFVKRVEGTIYVEALRGRGPRSSKCLAGFRFGPSSAGRRAIGELRAGIRARGQDEGLLMLAGRLAEDAVAEWKQPGPPIEIADGPAMAETCIRHGVGVISAMVSVDFVDADFFADIAEG
jgi:hypothetical protein